MPSLKMATDPNGTPQGRGPSPLPTGHCAGGDGKRKVGAESQGRAGRSATPSRAHPSPAPRPSVRLGVLARPGARAACRDIRPAQPVLPSCAAVARSAFLPRWWRWVRGDYRRRQGLLPIARIPTRHTSLARAPCRRVVICRPGRPPSASDLRFTSADPGRRQRRLPQLLLAVARGL